LLVTENLLRAQAAVLQKSVQKSASRILNEQASANRMDFDIFLSHSKADEEVILGAKSMFEDKGFSVYVDWIDDPHLDRSQVTAKTAGELRERMSQCKMLVYAHSLNSAASTWMPWELGYFDGKTGKIGILPIATGSTLEFEGNEYLGLYPYIDFVAPEGEPEREFWINRSFHVYAPLRGWLHRDVEIRDRTPG
jgi:hypothetical protein